MPKKHLFILLFFVITLALSGCRNRDNHNSNANNNDQIEEKKTDDSASEGEKGDVEKNVEKTNDYNFETQQDIGQVNTMENGDTIEIIGLVETSDEAAEIWKGTRIIGIQNKYTSEELGISFYFLGEDTYKNAKNPIITGQTVQRQGNKVYIYSPGEEDDPTIGQSVEMFKKDPQKSLSLSVEEEFLSGYNREECFTKQIQDDRKLLEKGFEIVEIRYPIDESNTDDPFWINAENCPEGYTTTNGISYFAMHKDYPDRYFYFSIGQYAIFGDAESNAWQKLFEVF